MINKYYNKIVTILSDPKGSVTSGYEKSNYEVKGIGRHLVLTKCTIVLSKRFTQVFSTETCRFTNITWKFVVRRNDLSNHKYLYCYLIRNENCYTDNCFSSIVFSEEL